MNLLARFFAFGRPDDLLATAPARLELRVALRKQASLAQQLEHWIDQAIRARAERDRAETCLALAVTEKGDLTARILVLEGELDRYQQVQVSFCADTRPVTRAINRAHRALNKIQRGAGRRKKKR